MGQRGAKAFLDGLQAKGIRLGLERIKKFLAFAGNPEKSFRSVHIAGTNGKGSTAAMLESILREAGYRTGLYTSPHLVSFNERIRVDGKSISGEELEALVSETRQEMKQSGVKLTYFEFVTAMAFTHFRKTGVEIAVVETGMGGRLDATNVVTPMLSVITNVEKEHEAFLGKTVERISLEKAGIIKKGIPVVTAEWKKPVLEILRKECRKKNSSLEIVEKPFGGKLKLKGGFQKWNAATAKAAAEKLAGQGLKVSEKAIEEGLAKAGWPGRFQLLHESPKVFVDCCHNPSGCFALAKAFREAFPGKKAVLVIGISSDKNAAAMAKQLAPIAGKVFATNAEYRAMPPEKISACFEKQGIETETVQGLESALRKALSESSENALVLVAGSCFVAGQAIKFFSKAGKGF